MELFFRVVNQYNALEKIPVQHSAEHALFHSERHMLDRLGDHPDLNVTELAQSAGVTKGAISQILKKLEGKALVRRYKKATSDKEVFVELTGIGRQVHGERIEHHAAAVLPLVQELSRYSEQEVAVLIGFFRWLDGFMEQSRKEMQSHSDRR